MHPISFLSYNNKGKYKTWRFEESEIANFSICDSNLTSTRHLVYFLSLYFHVYIKMLSYDKRIAFIPLLSHSISSNIDYLLDLTDKPQPTHLYLFRTFKDNISTYSSFIHHRFPSRSNVESLLF